MKFYAVCTMLTNVNNKIHFQLSAAEIIDAKETRLEKGLIGKIKSLYDSHSINGFRMFVWEDQLSDAKTEIVDFTRSHIEKRLQEYLAFQEVVKCSPEFVEEVWK